ncbi:DUF2339 domain-containing protein [Kutzneria albida]|uniref:DUF2339 domain-containing protein n=1 Tax=Kutzneria albida DSM 43870 TaxID=1449976 RepID=W5WVL2_9PSEU|nr:DUF2339 domain-containing protein [Kutzneria albida]AHI02160.1 hypothetical protein KALB_8803 [Kutzneria albida DSM 43870]
MTTPDPLAALAAELDQIGHRLYAVSQELRRQQQLAARPVAPPVQPMAPPPVMPAPVAQPAVMPAPQPVPPVVHYPTLPPAPPQESVYERLSKDGAGSKVLAWVGGAVTLFGMVLLLVLAVQRGWLGPLPRVLCGAGLGGVLVAAGLWVHRSPAGRAGAFALAATGFGVLYLDVVAATSLYEFLPNWAGLLVGLVVAAAGLALAARWDSQPLAAFVALGCAVCDPILTQGFTPLLVAFLIVLQVGALPVHLLRSWPGLALATGLPPLIGALFSTVSSLRQPADGHAIAAAALVAMLVGLVVAVITLRRRTEDAVPLVLMTTAPLTPMAAAVLLPRWEAAGLAGIVVLAMAGIALADRWLTRASTLIGTIVGALALVQATVIATDGATKAVLLVAEAAALAVLATVVRRREVVLASAILGAIGVLVGFGRVPPTLLLLGHPLDVVASGALLGALTLATAVLLPVAGVRSGLIGTATREPVPWVLAGLVGLYGAAGTVICCALLVSPDRTGFLFGHAVVTVSWTVGAVLLLLRGIASAALRATGLVLVGAAVLKLVLFDLAALDGMARVAAFLVAGLLLLLAGTRYARLVSGGRVITDESQGVTIQAQD